MTAPVFLSPALPSELLSYILDYHAYPTTLVICSSRADFLASTIRDIRQQSRKPASATTRPEDSSHYHHHNHHHHNPIKKDEQEHEQEQEEPLEIKHPLLTSPLHQIATSRHIRVIHTPTVTHLRAILSIFSPSDSRVSVPPPQPPVTDSKKKKPPHIIVYGLLALHRDTSEWSAQGLGNTASGLVELAHRLAWGVLVVEPRLSREHTQHSSSSSPVSSSYPPPPPPPSTLEELLREVMPVLNGGARRLRPDSEEGAWSGRTVEAGRVLGRWFRFQRVCWEEPTKVTAN